ncbi:cytoskeleton assembly control protein [Ramicandelaber brevisporus]|nr:cytoskeleton assembly control protein [Ramicandelaber brevisporus]
MSLGFGLHGANRAKEDEKLLTAVRKACSTEEVSPKHKHVRTCIVYTHNFKTAAPFFLALTSLPLNYDEIQCWKSLIVVHKVVRDGDPSALQAAFDNFKFLENIFQHSTSNAFGWRGYCALIRAYVNFILAKLEFHKLHPKFRADFDYDEFLSLRGVDDPNAGFETISDLMNLQDRLDEVQKLIMSHLNAATNNECRVAAFVPLVEESYAIYKFSTRMLIAMHKTIDSAEDSLLPLRERYAGQHSNLRKFYRNCEQMPYLTRLIKIPTLPRDPPNLFGEDEWATGAAPGLPARRGLAQSPIPDAPSPDNDDAELEEAMRRSRLDEEERQRKATAEQEAREAAEQRQRELDAERTRQHREFEEGQRAMAERERQERERLERQQQEQRAMAAQQSLNQMQQSMIELQNQHERDKLMLDQYQQRIQFLETQMQQLSTNAQNSDASRDAYIRQLQEQIEQWRNKYQSLAKLYAQLREEHLGVLGKVKDMSTKLRQAGEMRARFEKMDADMRRKNDELADMMGERDRARSELQRTSESNTVTIDRLRTDLAEASARVRDLSGARGGEVGKLTSQFNSDKAELDRLLNEARRQQDDLRRQLDDANAKMAAEIKRRDEELEIARASIDQSLLHIASLQETQQSSAGGVSSDELQRQIDAMTVEHIARLKRVVDSVLQSGIDKIDEALFEYSSAAHPGNTSAASAYVLSMAEAAQTAAQEFARSFASYIASDGGANDAFLDLQTPVIQSSANLAQAMAQLLHNAKGLTRLLETDEATDELLNAGRSLAVEGARAFLWNMQTARLEKVSASQRPSRINASNTAVQSLTAKFISVVERLVPNDAAATAARLTGGDDDLGDVVEREMNSAAKAISEAADRLLELSRRPRDNAGLDSHTISVHDAILQASLQLTNAIGILIKRAKETQQEIVAHGRGSLSSTTFYKKNNRWTEGLISAARAVAFATRLLVETADGVLSETHTLPQLIVAANEVSAATAQLVAASRVKSVPFSRSQENLEVAAKAVTDATKVLVKAVDALVKRKQDDEADKVNYNDLSNTEFKKREMDLQVEILNLDNELVLARRRLADMRRAGYHLDPDNF